MNSPGSSDRPPAPAPGPVRSPFADIPPLDYVRDAVALVLLFAAMFLPWSRELSLTEGDGGVIAIFVLVTLLSTGSLGLPYLARLGMLGATWNTRSLARLRILTNAPYALAVAALLAYDIFDGLRRFADDDKSSQYLHGVGLGAWLGTAGVVLAMQPRVAETRLSSESGELWLRAVRVLGLITICVSVASGVVDLIDLGRHAADNLETTGEVVRAYLIAIVLIVSAVAVLIAILFGPKAQFASVRFAAGGFALAFVLASALLAFGQLTRIGSFHWAMGYSPMVLLIAVGTVAWIPVSLTTSAIDAHEGHLVWSGIRRLFVVIAVFGFGSAVADGLRAMFAKTSTLFDLIRVFMCDGESFECTAFNGEFDWLERGDLAALAVFAALIGALGVVGARQAGVQAASSDPRPSREVAIGIAGAITLISVGSLVTQQFVQEPNFATPVAVSIPIVGLLIIAAICVLKPMRNLYAGVPLFANARDQTGSAPGLPRGYAPYVPPPPAPEPEADSSNGHDADAVAAHDPGTSQQELARIAHVRPDLRPAIAAHPSAYAGLLDWLAALGDPAVTAALASRKPATGRLEE